MPEKRFIANSKNDRSVWYDPETSHTATHITDTPQLLGLAAEIIRKTIAEGGFIMFHTDIGWIIGESDLVDNDPGDEIVYAKRLNRSEWTVFNKSKLPQPSSLVSVALEYRDDNSYELVSTWIGPCDSPSFPGTEREMPESKEYWSKHALAWGRQATQPNPETTICPW